MSDFWIGFLAGWGVGLIVIPPLTYKLLQGSFDRDLKRLFEKRLAAYEASARQLAQEVLAGR